MYLSFTLLPSQFPLLPVGSASVLWDSRFATLRTVFPLQSFQAPPPPETRSYFGAPFLRVPAHQHRGVVLEQRVRGGNHGGSWSNSPAAAPPGRALFIVTMETPSSLMAWAGLRSWAGPAGLQFLRSFCEKSSVLSLSGLRLNGSLRYSWKQGNRRSRPYVASNAQSE